jgi:ABC-2 type transport system permease protein
MQGWLKLTWVETKLFLRDPTAAFFALAFPLLSIFVFGSIYGNKPTPFFGGHGTIDASVPAYMAMVIAINGLLYLPVVIATYRERGILLRLQATPLRPLAVLVAEIVVSFMITMIGTILLIIAARVVYDLHFFGNPFSVLVAFMLGTFSIFSLGFVVASLAPNVRTAEFVGLAIFMVMMFLSGATFPSQMFPPALKQVTQFLPLTHVVTLLQGMWLGNAWGSHLLEVVVLASLLVVSVIVSARFFRWR